MLRALDECMVGSLAGRRILLVEDDPFISLDLQLTLEEAGASVIGPANSVSKALALMERSGLSAAVLDYRLAGEDTRTLAHVLMGRGIPFLFQTSDPRAIPAEFGVVPVLSKPFRPAQFVSAVEGLLRVRRPDWASHGDSRVQAID